MPYSPPAAPSKFEKIYEALSKSSHPGASLDLMIRPKRKCKNDEKFKVPVFLSKKMYFGRGFLKMIAGPQDVVATEQK